MGVLQLTVLVHRDGLDYIGIGLHCTTKLPKFLGPGEGEHANKKVMLNPVLTLFISSIKHSIT